MDNDDDFDIIDNTLNITVDVDDDREDEMEEDEEEQENNNKKNNTKTDQSIVGYAKTINLNIDLNKAFNWYKENYIGKFDLENNEPPEITANGDYTTTDTNDNNYQEINNYVPPVLTKSIEPNNKKTRSLYSNYFKVNVSPPIITSPITSNGYYKFDGNTLISGTDQDYNIYINIETTSLPTLYLSDLIFEKYCRYEKYSNTNIYYTGAVIDNNNNKNVYHYLNEQNNTKQIDIGTSTYYTYHSNNTSYIPGNIVIIISKVFGNTWTIQYNFNETNSSYTLNSNDVYIVSIPIKPYTYNGTENITICYINNSKFNIREQYDYINADIVDDITQNQSNSE